MNENDLETRLEEALKAAWTHNDAAHDISHIRRVRRNALAIAEMEDPAPDPDVLLAAVWLHDLVMLEKNDPDRSRASKLAADEAFQLLHGWGWNAEKANAAAHAIEAHSYSAGIEPRTIEAKILRDADRLDAIGAIGIARTFSISGRLGRALYDDTDPQAAHRPLDDNRFALDHFAVKLLKLGDGMLTQAGRAMALERTKFMRGFVEVFLAEVTRPDEYS